MDNVKQISFKDLRFDGLDDITDCLGILSSIVLDLGIQY